MPKVVELDHENRDTSFQSVLGYIHNNRGYLDLDNLRTYEDMSLVENNPNLFFAEEDFIVKSRKRGASAAKLGNLWIKINAGGKASFDTEVYYLDTLTRKQNLLFSYNNERYSGLRFENMFPFFMQALYKNSLTHTSSPQYGKNCLLNSFATRVRSCLLDMALGKKSHQTNFRVAFTDLMTLYDILHCKQKNNSELTGLDIVDFGKDMSIKPKNKRDVAAKIAASFFLNTGFQDGEIENIIHEYIEESGKSVNYINEDWISSLLEQYVDKNRYSLVGILTSETLAGCIKSLQNKCETYYRTNYTQNIDDSEKSMSKEEIESYVKLWNSIKVLYDKRELIYDKQELIEFINITTELFATIVKTFTEVNVTKQKQIQMLRQLCCQCRDIMVKNKADYVSMLEIIDTDITNLENSQPKDNLFSEGFMDVSKNLNTYLTELLNRAQNSDASKADTQLMSNLHKNLIDERDNFIAVIENKEDIKKACAKFTEEYTKHIIEVNRILSRTGFYYYYIQPACKLIISLLLGFLVFVNCMSKNDSIDFLEKYFPPPTDAYVAAQWNALNTKERFFGDSKNPGLLKELNDYCNSELLLNKIS